MPCTTFSSPLILRTLQRRSLFNSYFLNTYCVPGTETHSGTQRRRASPIVTVLIYPALLFSQKKGFMPDIVLFTHLLVSPTRTAETGILDHSFHDIWIPAFKMGLASLRGTLWDFFLLFLRMDPKSLRWRKNLERHWFRDGFGTAGAENCPGRKYSVGSDKVPP